MVHAAPASAAATTPASSASSSSASPPFPTTKADVFGLDHYRSLLPFSPYPTQSRPPDHEEISTIFVVGFPDDMHEREFQNMFTFSLGFEAATLKIPNKDSSAYAPRQQPFAPAAAQDPYNLVTVNSGGVVVDGPHGTSSSWQQHEHAHSHHLPPAPPRKQIIGFAKFRSRQEALDARDVLQGRRVDIEKGAVLKAEMAKKNLHTKRGVGPLGLPLGLVPSAPAPAAPPDVATPFSASDPLSQKDRQLAALGAMGLATVPRRLDDDKRPTHDENRKDKDALDRERDRNNKLRMNNTTLYDAFHSVPVASSRPSPAFADSATGFPGYAFQNTTGSGFGSNGSGFGPNGSGLGSNGSSAFSPNGNSAFSPNGSAFAQNGGSAFAPNGNPAFAQNGGLNGNPAFAPFPTQQPSSASAWGLPSKPNSPPPPFFHSPPSSVAGGSQASSIEGEFSRTLTIAVTPPLLHTHLDSHSPTLQHHHPSPLMTHPHPHQGMTSPQLPSPGSGGSSTGAGGPKQGGPGNASDQNPPINTLYVGNLPNSPAPAGYPPNYLEESLRVLFARCPGYRKLCFRQKSNGPMCFVEFEDVEFATKALNNLYGNQLNGFVKGGIRLSFSKNPLGVRPAAQGQVPAQTRREWGSPQQVQMQVQQLQLQQQQSQPPQLQQQSQLQQSQLQQSQLQQAQLQQPPQLQQPQLQQHSQLQQPQLQQQHSQVPQQPVLHHHQQQQQPQQQQHTGLNYVSMHDAFHTRGPPQQQQQQGLSLDVGSGRRHDANTNDLGSPSLIYGYATSPPPSRFFSPPLTQSSASQSSFATPTVLSASSSAFPRYSQTLGGSQHSPPFFHEGDERVRFRDAPPHAFSPSPGIESTRAG